MCAWQRPKCSPVARSSRRGAWMGQRPLPSWPLLSATTIMISITNSQPQEAGLIIDHLLVPLFRLLKLKWQYSGVAATPGQPNLAFSLLRCIQLNVEARPDYHRGENKFSIDPLHTEHTSNTHCSNTLNKYTIPVPFTPMDVCKISTSCYFLAPWQLKTRRRLFEYLTNT